MALIDLDRFMKKAGQKYAVVRNGERLPLVDGLQNVEKPTGRRYVGFRPGTDIRPGDWVEGQLSGDRSYIEDVASDVLEGRVFMVKGYALTAQEYDVRFPKKEAVSVTTEAVDARKVFVVFGRNVAARNEMYAFLSALGLRPIEFDDAVRATGEGAPTIDRILDAAFDMAQAVLILFTGDDEARLRPDLHKPDDPTYETELTPQPRPNVLFEAGMAFGRHPKRSILVQMGYVRPFSDASARYAIKFDGDRDGRVKLKERLKTAGCLVDDSGQFWYTAGDFSKALPQSAR